MIKKLAFAFCLSVLFATLPATADEWNKKTTITFSGPVELPGIVLPTGTYVFKLIDSASDRHIVEVTNADETEVYAIVLAIPNYQITRVDKTVLTFKERPANTPEAIRAWFYPGDNFGQEFVYPKARGAEIAAAAKVPVLTGEVKPAEKAEELIKEPVVAATPKKEVEMAPVIAPSQPETPLPVAVQPTPEPPAPAPELPKTASPFPLLMLAGFGSLGLAAALRAISKHTA